ncbi:class I SAM-dependent methyltransferase [Paenibacillus alginolyticus]|uniref:class I SAM-dependent methyltransferase n=1 Tax=Paenibacillus alginolyticus TaxID=59839 RepID=UPI000406D5C7|nr:class I SAM-dependent methyltransferase [Paenibacillus alginolyticus]MCY9663999.1 class I SAM-dependent methyltransferase [Paenibacillus alginolyticus]
MEKYYFEEHEKTYQEIKRDNLEAWDQYHDPTLYNFENFMMRPFLERALEFINVTSTDSTVFEYGCGTGAGACFLANKGFTVDAIDISPTAIELAKSIALKRNLNINYTNKDLLEMTELNKEYDLILDNYCLQSLVTDGDRSKLYAIIKSGLKKSGYYIISSAMYDEQRSYGENTYYCGDTSIVYDRIISPGPYNETIMINNEWWKPKRRHLKTEALSEELKSNGFLILLQENGNIVCKKNDIR